MAEVIVGLGGESSERKKPQNLRGIVAVIDHHVQFVSYLFDVHFVLIFPLIDPERTSRLFVLQIIDEAAIVQFLDKLAVDEILRLGLFGFGIFCNQRVNYGLETRLRRILLCRKRVLRDRGVVTLLEQFPIGRATHVFCQDLEPGGSVGFHQMYSLDLRLDVSSHGFGILVDEFSGRHHAIILKRQCAQIGQHIETFSLSYEGRGRIEQSRLYFSGPKSDQAFRRAADDDHGSVFTRHESKFSQNELGGCG